MVAGFLQITLLQLCVASRPVLRLYVGWVVKLLMKDAKQG